MRYRRTPIELESPEQLGYDRITNNLSESSFSDMCLADYGIEADVGQLCCHTAITVGRNGYARSSQPAAEISGLRMFS